MIDSKQLQVALDHAGQPVLLGKGAYGAVHLLLSATTTLINLPVSSSAPPESNSKPCKGPAGLQCKA